MGGELRVEQILTWKLHNRGDLTTKGEMLWHKMCVESIHVQEGVPMVGLRNSETGDGFVLQTSIPKKEITDLIARGEIWACREAQEELSERLNRID